MVGVGVRQGDFCGGAAALAAGEDLEGGDCCPCVGEIGEEYAGEECGGERSFHGEL